VRIGFDVSPLHRPFPPGLVRAVAGAVSALEASGRLEVVRLAPADGEPLRRFRRRRLPAEARRLGLAGVHSFTSAFALRGPGRRVQTIHELPWRHGVRENADLAHRLWARLGPWRADRVVCPTAHVARDLGRAGRVVVVPWGVGAPFGPDPPPGAVDETLLERLRLSGDPLVVCPGAVRAKKDLAAVLQGLAELHRRGGPRPALVVTGGDTPDLRRDLGLASRLGLSRWIATVGLLDEAELAGLYRLAAVVPVLSRSEGFGLPVLEALASGTPVLVPPGSAQAEVAGSAGIVVDPADPVAVADGLARALAERGPRRSTGLARAAEFPWERTAKGIETLWEELA